MDLKRRRTFLKNRPDNCPAGERVSLGADPTTFCSEPGTSSLLEHVGSQQSSEEAFNNKLGSGLFEDVN
ncbi:4-glucan branching enzyme, partial [Clarias magur]